jgi:hypothetical protein
MGFLSAIGLGKQVGETIAEPIDAIGNVFDKLFTSDEERAAGQLVLKKLRQRPMELQNEINKLEAQHRSIYVAGWRPFIGWVCGMSLAFYYLPQFLMASILWTRMCWAKSELLAYPVTEISGLMELVIALLGLAAYRTAEKALNKTK